MIMATFASATRPMKDSMKVLQDNSNCLDNIINHLSLYIYMVLKYVYNCFCPRIIDEEEIKIEPSHENIATLLPYDFIPENEPNHHRVSNTPCNSSAVATVYNTLVARSNHGSPALELYHGEDQQHDRRSTIAQLCCRWR